MRGQRSSRPPSDRASQERQHRENEEDEEQEHAARKAEDDSGPEHEPRVLSGVVVNVQSVLHESSRTLHRLLDRLDSLPHGSFRYKSAQGTVGP
jgi:hypothetical protein